MKLARDSAVVLRAVAYRDADKRVTLLTAEHGKLVAVARGALRSRKRFGGVLEPLNRVRAEWSERERGGMATLASAQAERIDARFREDYGAMAAGMYALELADKLSEEHQIVPHLYEGLVEVLRLLAAGAEPAPLLRAFELKVISVIGFRPVLGHCARCGGALAGRLGFSADAGGAVCETCSHGVANWRMSEGALLSMRKLLGTPLAQIPEEVPLSSAIRAELARLVPGFVQMVSGKTFKALALVDSGLPEPVPAPGAKGPGPERGEEG